MIPRLLKNKKTLNNKLNKTKHVYAIIEEGIKIPWATKKPFKYEEVMSQSNCSRFFYFYFIYYFVFFRGDYLLNFPQNMVRNRWICRFERLSLYNQSVLGFHNPFMHWEMQFTERNIVFSLRFVWSDSGQKYGNIEHLENAFYFIWYHIQQYITLPTLMGL